MATDRLYYGGIIPDDFFTRWYSDIQVWNDANIYNQMARRLLSFRPVAPETEDYGITMEDITKTIVEPKARNVAGEDVNVGGSDKSYKVFRWPTGFRFSEDAVKKDARLQSRRVEACQARISYSEDNVFLNGRAANGIVGLAQAALQNKKGTITAATNQGAWLTDDGARNIYQDCLNLRGLIASKYRSNLGSLWMLTNTTVADAFDQTDPEADNGSLIADKVCKLLGRSPASPRASWLMINDQIPANTLYLVCKNAEVAELVEANPIVIDDNYPRQPIGNLQVAVYQDVGIAIHDPNGMAVMNVG